MATLEVLPEIQPPIYQEVEMRLQVKLVLNCDFHFPINTTRKVTVIMLTYQFVLVD